MTSEESMNSKEEPSFHQFMDDPDVALMLRFQQGDEGAFRELVDRHTDSLINFFTYQSGNRAVAEDCTQEVWSRMFRSRNDYEPRARFRTFLFRVARNLWIDTLRTGNRRRREIQISSDESGEGAGGGDPLAFLAGPELPPDQHLREGELAGALARALGKLPSEMREVFILGGIEGVGYAEIADTLEIPIGTVKSRMFNAVRRLREMLQPYWEKEK